MDSFTHRPVNSAAECVALRICSFSRSLAVAGSAVLLAAAALRSTAAAQQDSSTAYPSRESNPAVSDTQGKARFSLGGAVVNSVTGEPVPRALVSASNRQYVMTDSSGHFQVDGLPRGDVLLTAAKPGFFNPDPAGPLQEPSVRVSLNADVGDAVLKLMPQAVVAGRITSLAGVPLEDFPVRLYARKIVEGRAQWQAAGTTQTDEDGQFRVADLRPGQYCLSAGPEHKNLFATDAEERESSAGKANNRPRGYPEVFYPNTSELASATTINLLAGQQFQADFALNQEPLYELSGNVIGAPAEGGVGWALFNSSGEQLNSLRVRAQGQKFFGFVPAGRYTLRFFARVNNQQLAATVPVHLAANLTGIQAVLAPEAAIPVNIRVESSAPRRPGQSILQVVVRLRPVAAGLDQNEYGSVPAQEGGAETFVSGVPPGTYSVEVLAFGTNYVQSAISGTTDLLSEPLVVPFGSKVDPIEVTLRADGGHVEGTLQGQGVGMVLLVPERGPTADIKSMEAQGGGSFSFDQVRPGEYFLLAIQQSGDFEYENPEVLSPYLSRATHVTVNPKQDMNINLEMFTTGK